MKTDLEEMEAAVETTEGELNVRDLEATQATVEWQEVYREMNMDGNGALEDRYGDQRLAAQHCRQPVKQSQGSGGFWKMLATAQRQINDTPCSSCTAQGT